MPSQLEQIVGFQFKDKEVGWNTRDLITYALGVGAKVDEPQFISELHPSFAAIPTYPAVLMHKGNSQDVVNFSSVERKETVPGLPKMDLKRMVHATQHMDILRPLPLVSGPGWQWKATYTGVNENKKGIVVQTSYQLVDPQGTPYVNIVASTFNIGAKTDGGLFAKYIVTTPQAKPVPGGKPHWQVTEVTSAEQAAVYRLSGDYNPLHIDPSIGKGSGFGGVILHGLCTFGFAARAVIKLVGGGDPKSLKSIGVRFTSPVKPGDTLETQIWEVGKGPDGTTELAFQTVDLSTGKVVLGQGFALVVKSEKAKL